MMNTEKTWIGEIVEWSDPVFLTIEVYPQLENTTELRLLQVQHKADVSILATLSMRRLPLDSTRKTLALNMDEATIQSSYPQQSLFVKQYFTCFLTGSILEGQFHQSLSSFGMGIHSRVSVFENEWKQWLLNNEMALFSFLSSFSKDPRLTPLLKDIGKSLLRLSPDISFQQLLFKQLTLLFKDQYFVLKELLHYLQS